VSESAPRIAVLGFRPASGGIGRVMINLLAGMARRGVELDLLLPPGEHPDLAGTEAHFSRFFLDADRPEQAAAELRDYLAERRPRAVLSNKDQTNALLARETERGARPFTVFRVGTDVLEKLKRSDPLTHLWKRRRLAILYRSADALIGISAGGSEALRRLLGGTARPPIHTIWNPVDLPAVRALAQAPIEHPWFQPGRRPVIVSVGRLVAAKDYSTLLRAFGLLRRWLDCRLVIVGEGRQRERLMRLARKLGVAHDFDLPGFRANPFPFVARADLFVASSIFEGANNALMEALALGAPCVSTDCRSGPREVLEGGRYGRLVPVGDAAALADAMLATLRAPPDRAMLRAGAERFDLDTSARGYLAVLLDGAGGPVA
jgi:glycosyltransferase involved in cell wall biosynthesis